MTEHECHCEQEHQAQHAHSYDYDPGYAEDASSNEDACTCGCAHEHEHEHCDCGGDHEHHDCDCDREHHDHEHIEKSIPAIDFDVEEMGLGWEGVCPCGCGGLGHHDPAGGLGGSEAETADALAWRAWVNAEPDTYEEFQQGYAFDTDGNLLEELVEEIPEPAFAEFPYEHEGIVYHVRRWGEAGEIPLVALHGFMQTGAAWESVAPRLAQDHCLYAIDLVGHGNTSRPANPEPYAIASQADAIAAFISEVVLPQAAEGAQGRMPAKRAHLMGYSMGGRIALDVALRHGELLNSLILESAGIGPADEAERASLAERAAGWAQQLRSEGMEAFVDYWETLPLFETQQRLEDEAKAAVRAERLANDAEAMALAVEAAGAHTMALADETMEALGLCWTPVFYVAGTRDEKHLVLAERFVKEGMDAKAVMGGHNLHLEVPKLFAEALGPHFRNNEIRGF